ncbi:acetyl-CoA carboxylase biotin carboxyl carrier protein [Spongiactinospora sp. TRM90649]|uniref:acetyl-CoA carboxylase biotin carboxyl carrier protein n=1 Tax=Spongiactinospora sp. TRM90649 TaxID=3031114 RepID=UPI0023F863B8|nr:acetyl-CoA carboxylase biotin carboxyl carrier protein [Spongiactinospora sp. TRM90649]MDF5755375.1 acetyl-CoA carboxylase biotin carboxyl carrier protein [Spongiactinospora sp. TRM90649]
MADDLLPVGSERGEELRLLRAEVSSLVKTIPGAVERVALRVGECSLEIAWARPAVTAASVESAADVSSGGLAEESPTDPAVRSVLAPLVGTFYTAPQPGAAPFVRQGDRLEPGQAVGIVEAMKLMNQVPCEWPGEVVEILVADGEPVEYGQELMRVRVEGPA